MSRLLTEVMKQALRASHETKLPVPLPRHTKGVLDELHTLTPEQVTKVAAGIVSMANLAYVVTEKTRDKTEEVDPGTFDVVY